jgi:hypothetical protein
MPGATAAEVLSMDRKAAQVRAALEKAESEVSLWRLLPSVLRTSAQDAALKNLDTARARFEQWADSKAGWRGWALRGTEPNGHPYPVSFWLRIGDDLLSELGVHVRAVEQGSNVAVVKNTAEATAKEAGTLARKATSVVTDPWPLHWKLAAGAVATATTLGLAVWLLKEARPYLAAAERLAGKEGQ